MKSFTSRPPLTVISRLPEHSIEVCYRHEVLLKSFFFFLWTPTFFNFFSPPVHPPTSAMPSVYGSPWWRKRRNDWCSHHCSTRHGQWRGLSQRRWPARHAVLARARHLVRSLMAGAHSLLLLPLLPKPLPQKVRAEVIIITNLLMLTFVLNTLSLPSPLTY